MAFSSFDGGSSSFHDPSMDGRIDPETGIASLELIEALLIEAALWWRQEPRVGPAPVKSSWPQTVLLTQEEWAGQVVAGVQADAPRPLPLTREQIRMRSLRSAWLEVLDNDLERKLVAEVLNSKAQGAPRGRMEADWKRVVPVLQRHGARGGKAAMQRRYDRLMGLICRRVNACGLVARALPGGERQ